MRDGLGVEGRVEGLLAAIAAQDIGDVGGEVDGVNGELTGSIEKVGSELTGSDVEVVGEVDGVGGEIFDEIGGESTDSGAGVVDEDENVLDGTNISPAVLTDIVVAADSIFGFFACLVRTCSWSLVLLSNLVLQRLQVKPSACF